MSSIKEYENIISGIERMTYSNEYGNSRKIFNIQEVIKVFREKQKVTIIPTIREIVTLTLNFPPEILDKKTRKLDVVKLRQLTAWFYWNYTLLSTPKIAIEVSDGSYDHTSVLHCIKKIDELITVDKETRLTISVITENIQKYYEKTIRETK